MAGTNSSAILTVSLRFDGMTWGALRGLVKLADQCGKGDDTEVLYDATVDDDSGILELHGIDLIMRAAVLLAATS